VESAGAPTAVVTPFGDTPTSSGAIDVGTTDEVDGAVGDGVGAGPVADEHPDRITRPATTARKGYLCIPAIYETLGSVRDATRFQECCQD